MPAEEMRLNQVALSVRDRHASLQWYRSVFGYLDAGEMVPHEIPDGPDAAGLQGIPGAKWGMTWAVDQQRFFQLEFFQYSVPEVRPVPPHWSPADIGYTMVSFHVDDFDATLDRATATGHDPLTEPIGGPGARRVCLRDPDGVLLELMEDDPRTPNPDERVRPEVPVAARAIRASVPDLSRSHGYFADTLGMHPIDLALHSGDHEALWGLAGAKREVATYWAGDLFLELVQYEEPQGRPWPDGYRISDQGIVNFALGTRSRETFRETVGRALKAGYKGTKEVRMDVVEANYLMDDQGFSVEHWFVDESADAAVGLLPIEA